MNDRLHISSNVPADIAERDSDRCKVDSAPYETAALDAVVETVMLFGQWPQPREGKFRRVQFSLMDFLHEEYTDAELATLAFCGVMQWEAEIDWQLSKHRDELQARLRKHLERSQIVLDHAERLAQEAAEDAALDAELAREQV